MKMFEIYFSDLNEDAQVKLCKEFETSLDMENWETFPIAVIEREED